MNQKKRFSRGFTLIELLVVIAIIGILTSVVLASLNSARSKGGDAGVKDNLSSVRTQTEIYYGDNSNSYGAVLAAAECPTSGTTMFNADANIKNAIAQAKVDGGGTTNCAAGAASGNASSWAVNVQLKTLNGTSAQFWCVDSSGMAATTTSNVVTGGGTTVAKCL